MAGELPTNADIAARLALLGDLLEIEGAIRHRVLAYRRGAARVRATNESVAELALQGRAVELADIGDTLQAKIVELVETGEISALQKARERIPEGLAAVARIDGIGPKRAAALWSALGITSVNDLAAALAEDRLLRRRRHRAGHAAADRGRHPEGGGARPRRGAHPAGAGPPRGRGAARRAARRRPRRPGGDRGQPAPRTRDGARHRHRRHGRRPARPGRGAARAAVGAAGALGGRRRRGRPHPFGAARRGRGGPGRVVRQPAAARHRVGGAQHPPPRDGRPPRPLHVAARDRRPGRHRHPRRRGGRLRRPRPRVDPARAARGLRRARGGRAGAAARAGDARGPAGRAALAHHVERRHARRGGHGRGGPPARLPLPGGERPLPEPRHGRRPGPRARAPPVGRDPRGGRPARRHHGAARDRGGHPRRRAHRLRRRAAGGVRLGHREPPLRA